MFLKPFGYTNQVQWWDICAPYFADDMSVPDSGEYIEVKYKWAIHESVLWENDCSYSSRKDGHIEHITPYQFYQAPEGVEWENECSLAEWWRQLEFVSPQWLQPFLNPTRSINRWWFWKQRSIEAFLDTHWWHMPTYERRSSRRRGQL
jgi:hypothetical protein